MKIKFWGVRGSIASPGPHTVRYGGNTTCIEVRTDNNELIILDAGTGIFPLSQTLLAELPVQAHLFISHSHWDHIQGLPFFMPAFIPGNVLRLHGPSDPVSGQGVEQVMAVQLQHSYFPVREPRGTIECVTLLPQQSIRVGSTTITPYPLNHSRINFGYRIETPGKSVFFTGDYEPPYNLHAPGDAQYAEYQALVDTQQAAILQAMQGVDVLIADTSYTAQEYPAKQGWGHGTFQSSIQAACQAGAKVLYCTHHESTRSDDALEAAFAQALAENPVPAGGPEIRLAREGHSHEF